MPSNDGCDRGRGHPLLRRQKSISGGKHGVRRRRVRRKFAPLPVRLETDDASVDMASFMRRSLADGTHELQSRIALSRYRVSNHPSFINMAMADHPTFVSIPDTVIRNAERATD